MGSFKKQCFFRCSGFTILEVICVLVLLGLLGLLTTRMFTNLVQGYTFARNSDAAVQKAQNAMQRMTIDFTYLTLSTTTGGANTITYNTSLDTGNSITINQVGNRILYNYLGGSYILTDGVKSGSLQFSYYNSYTASADTASSSSTELIGISFTMVGDDASQGLSQTYATRVALNKLGE